MIFQNCLEANEANEAIKRLISETPKFNFSVKAVTKQQFHYFQATPKDLANKNFKKKYILFYVMSAKTC